MARALPVSMRHTAPLSAQGSPQGNAPSAFVHWSPSPKSTPLPAQPTTNNDRTEIPLSALISILYVPNLCPESVGLRHSRTDGCEALTRFLAPSASIDHSSFQSNSARICRA